MQYTFDVVVIGAGPGGYEAALYLAKQGLKTACIDKAALGGTCLNVGCIPSKTLLHATELLWKVNKGGESLGLHGSVEIDWDALQQKKTSVIQELNRGIEGLFKKYKVTFLSGEASFLSPHMLRVLGNDRESTVEASAFIIATGSEPIGLPFLPFDEKKVLSSTGILSMLQVPKSLVVVGAGVIGVELGSVFHRLGSKVSFIEFMDSVCPTFDKGISSALKSCLSKQGMDFFLSKRVVRGEVGDGVLLELESKDGTKDKIQSDVALIAIGRKSFTQRLDLDKAGIILSSKGQIPIDGNFRTQTPHIFAIGDVVDGPMLAHKASEEGIAAAKILAGKEAIVPYFAIPNVIYTHPEVATVGLTEAEALGLGRQIVIGQYPFKGNGRAKCMGEEEGFVKIVVDKATHKMLGVHIIGPQASELIALPAAALVEGKTVEEAGAFCQAHPTLIEAFKEAALSVSL